MTTQPPSAAAGEQFADAERILAALPLAKRRDRDHEVRIALVHAVLAIAASSVEPTSPTASNLCHPH